MLHFECDYNNGCSEKILQRLWETNSVAQSGYGADEYTFSAKEKIKKACACPDADVFFLAGGTQTNAVVISSVLKGYEGVVAAETGHVEGHEAGAIECTGHKVLTLPQTDGKISAADLKAYLAGYYADDNYDHMVFPGMVYISFPTEWGTIYSKSELENIHAVCKEYDIPLYIDGARLGYGLMSRECDMTFAEFAQCCDMFYVGGTKVGALCGEAVVFPRGNAPKHFFTSVKQHGALLAKGRLCGVQFETLFTDDHYFELSRNAIEMAECLKAVLKEKGYEFYKETCTNQQFVYATREKIAELKDKVAYGFWENCADGRTIIRFCTSWCTTEAAIDQLKEVL